MLIRAFNDIHLDFDLGKKANISNLWYPVSLPNDYQTTLILSGDIWHASKYLKFKNFSWLKEVSKKFAYVIFVLGNHDIWNGNLTFEYQKVKKEIKNQNLDNVFLLQNDIFELNNIRFVGATLWTDFNNGDPQAMEFAPLDGNDYKWIRIGLTYQKIKPRDLLQEHLKSKNFIFSNIQKTGNVEKIVVITHHAPSILSLLEKERTEEYELSNSVCYTSLEKEIENSHIDYWFHGHTHHPVNYTIGKTRVINNPRGYFGEQETGYNPENLLEI